MDNTPIYLKVGSTPGLTVGAATYINPDLALINYSLLENGYGLLFPQGAPNITDPDYNVIPTGGFTLLNGETFKQDQTFALTPISVIVAPSGESSNYTNGFDRVAVLSSLTKRLGWRQPTIAGSPVINSDNLTSTSGRYFNGQSFHSLVTIKNLMAVQEDPNISVDDFNTYLTDMQTDAIFRMLNEIFREKELIEQCLMYTRFATMDIPVNNSGQFVGWIINVANDFGIATQINTATLYFDQDCSFNLYLFQDGVLSPLKTIPVSCVAFERTEVDFDTLVLPFKTGQKYYFGYFQSEIGDARAIREQVEEFATTRCFEAFTFTAPAISNNTDFNHNYRQYGSLPQGINLEIISFRDHTQKILRKANLFDEGQGLQVAIMAIEQIMNSTRTNSTDSNVQGIVNSQRSFTELNQAFPTKDAPFMPGLKSRLLAELKRLHDTFFPPQEANSVSMMDNDYGIEDSWYKQNVQVFRNPPIQQT